VNKLIKTLKPIYFQMMIKKLIPFYVLVLSIFLSSCQSNSTTLASGSADSLAATQNSEEKPEEAEEQQTGGKKASAAEILARLRCPFCVIIR